MHTPVDQATGARARPELGHALLEAVDTIADMAHRVMRNGAEPTYASEKLGTVLFKAAEGLALCDAELEEIADEVRRGHAHGTRLRDADDDPR
jgi:hypothetical protein